MSKSWSDLVRKPSQSSSNPKFDEKINKDRFLFTILSLIGQQVNVHLKDGAVVEGLFHSASDPYVFFLFRIHISHLFNKFSKTTFMYFHPLLPFTHSPIHKAHSQSITRRNARTYTGRAIPSWTGSDWIYRWYVRYRSDL